MQSPPLHHPVPQHRVNVEATNAAYAYNGEQQYQGQPYEASYQADPTFQGQQQHQQQHQQHQQQPQQQHQQYQPQAQYSGQYAAQPPFNGQPQFNGQQYSNQQFSNQQYSSQYSSQQYSGQPAQSSAAGDPFNPLNFVGGSELGKHAFSYGQQYITRSFDSYGISATSLRYYFQVSNSYVRRKLTLILFPWRHKPWNRQLQPVQGAAGQEVYATPSEDLNAPDMYIPLMAFITHLIVIALGQGVEGKFHPEQFGARASKALALVIGELMMLKVATYLLSASSSSLFDLFAYSGYKFVALTLTTLAGLVSENRAVRWSVFAYTGGATAFFMLRSLKYILLPEYAPSNAATATTTISGSKRQQRIQFLFFYGVVCQLVQMWLLL